jgi:hypothetical protein
VHCYILALGAASKYLNDLVDIQHFLLAIFMTKTLMEKDLNNVFFSTFRELGISPQIAISRRIM